MATSVSELLYPCYFTLLYLQCSINYGDADECLRDSSIVEGCRFSYEVMVIASDGGDPPKSGSMIVSIKVVDANDNAPVFDNSTYEVRCRPLNSVRLLISSVYTRLL